MADGRSPVKTLFVRLCLAASLFLAYATVLPHPMGTPVAQASGTQVPRDRALWTAEDYRSHEWYADVSNATRYQSAGSHAGDTGGTPYLFGGWRTVAQFETDLG